MSFISIDLKSKAELAGNVAEDEGVGCKEYWDQYTDPLEMVASVTVHLGD